MPALDLHLALPPTSKHLALSPPHPLTCGQYPHVGPAVHLHLHGPHSGQEADFSEADKLPRRQYGCPRPEGGREGQDGLSGGEALRGKQQERNVRGRRCDKGQP